jgi:hypothetical protein
LGLSQAVTLGKRFDSGGYHRIPLDISPILR